MRILFISGFLPMENAKQAGINFTYNILKILKDNLRCSIDFLGTVNQSELNENMTSIKTLTDNQFVYSITKWRKLYNILAHALKPVIAAARYDNRIKREIHKISYINKYDFVFIDYIQNSLYLNDIRQYMPFTKTVLLEQDVAYLSFQRKMKMDNNIFKKLLLSMEYKRIKKFEVSIASKYDFVYTVSKKDANLLSTLKNVDVLFPFINKWTFEQEEHNGFNIMFWGAMCRTENEDAVLHFVKNIWPKVHQENTRLFIIGANPSQKVLDLASDYIIVTGFVEDPTVYFTKIDLSIIPLRLGAGIKIKVLESMANNIPVITTSVGAEGINIKDGVNGFVTDDVECFAERINLLKRDAELRINIKENALKFIMNNYGFLKNEAKLRKILR